MTLLYLDGFEGYSADIDFKSRPGWYTCNGVTPALCQTAFPVSLTEIGNSLTFSSNPPASGNCPYNATYSKNNGVAWSNGTTVYQGWKAGGFTMGMRLKNNGQTRPYAVESLSAGSGNGSYGYTNTIGFDGTKYWALASTNANSLYVVVWSYDLVTWNKALVQPSYLWSAGLNPQGMGLVVLGPDNVAVPILYNGGTTGAQYMVTSDGGKSWTMNAYNGVGSGAATTARILGLPTGNATYPLVFNDSINGNIKVLPTTTVSGLPYAPQVYNPTTVVTLAVNTTGSIGAVVAGGLCIFWGGNGTGATTSATVYSAVYGSSTINTSGAWTTATLTFSPLSIGGLCGMAYSSKLNKFCLVGSSGVALLAANGTPGNVTPITNASPQMVFNPLDIPIAVLCINNVFCVYCSGGTIYYSGDGYTWNQTYIPQISALATASWDGTRVILTSTAVTGIVVTSADGISNFASTYVADNVPYTQAAGVSFPNMITVEPNANTQLLNGNLWTYPGGNAANVYRMGFYPGALTTVRGTPVIPIYVGMFSGTATWTNQQTIYVDGSTLVHYYELVATADPKTPNNFFWSLLVDGAIVYKTPVSYSMAPTTDTASFLMFEPICTSQGFNQFDDLYICLNDGKGISGPQGPNIVLPVRPAGNVQNAWTASGSQSSNALALAGPTPSTNHNGVVSGNTSDKDLYTIAALPAGYQPAAVLVNASASRSINGGQPQVAVGLITNGVETDVTTNVNTPLGGSVVASMIAEKAPDGTAWTATSLANSQFALTHTG